MSYVVVQHLSSSYKSMLPQLLRLGNGAGHRSGGWPGPWFPIPSTSHPNRNVVLRDGILQLIESPGNFPETFGQSLSFLPRREEEIARTPSESSFREPDRMAPAACARSKRGADSTSPRIPGRRVTTACPIRYRYRMRGLDPDPRGDRQRTCAPRRGAPCSPHRPMSRNCRCPRSSACWPKCALRTKLDFSGYKEATSGVGSSAASSPIAKHARRHVEFVEEHPEELDHLARDILISVTSFSATGSPSRFSRKDYASPAPQRSPATKFGCGCPAARPAKRP